MGPNEGVIIYAYILHGSFLRQLLQLC